MTGFQFVVYGPMITPPGQGWFSASSSVYNQMTLFPFVNGLSVTDSTTAM